jgi:hypothetical protein
MAVGDINHDGNLDILVANSGSDDISILMNRGRNRFVAQSLRTGLAPRHVALGDLNGDLHLDFIVSNFEDGTLGLFRNSGRGTFRFQQSLSTGGDRPDALAMADWDGDGDLDIAAAASNRANGCAWLYFNERGEFRAYREFETVGRGTTGMAAADFNNDGILDFVTADRESNTMTVFLGRGEGMFYTAGRPLEIGDGPDELIAIDLDDDADIDVISMNADGKSVSVLYNITPEVFGF